MFCSVQRVGDKTPADLVLFAATDLKVDNSSLTGESEPQERFPLSEGSQQRPVEAENLVCTCCPLCSIKILSLLNIPGIQLYLDRQRRSMGM